MFLQLIPRRAQQLGLTLLVAAAAACGHFGMGQSGDGDALIVFKNEGLDQADVYALAPGSDWIRIGTVMPGRTDTLVVRNSLIMQGSGINVIARLLAKSSAPQSGTIPLRPGDIWEVRLPPDERTLVAVPARQ